MAVGGRENKATALEICTNTHTQIYIYIIFILYYIIHIYIVYKYINIKIIYNIKIK